MIKLLRRARTDYIVLSSFQNIGCFDFSRFIYFAMYLDICYILMYSKHYKSRKTKMTYILKWREYFSNFMYVVVPNTLVSVIQVLICIVVYQCLLSIDVILLEHVCSYLCTMM